MAMKQAWEIINNVAPIFLSSSLVFAFFFFFWQVAEHAMNAAFWNQSENCSCGSRLIVHEDVKDALLEKASLPRRRKRVN